MDKIVRRVTVVERGVSHERDDPHRKARVVYRSDRDDDDDDDASELHHRRAKVVYRSDRDDDDDDALGLQSLERGVRHLLKSQVVQAQEAYQQHLDSVAKGGSAWLYDAPFNLMRAGRKAARDLLGSGPSNKRKRDEDEED